MEHDYLVSSKTEAAVTDDENWPARSFSFSRFERVKFKLEREKSSQS